MAIEIIGNWKKGFALDLHTIKSEFAGYDDFGNPIFDTERTEIGELVYKLKYNNDYSVIPEIIAIIKKCNFSFQKFNFFIPIPPSNAYRKMQPVELVCDAMSREFDIPQLKEILKKKNGAEELKNVFDKEKRLELLKQYLEIQQPETVKNKNVLLIDDLYRSGSTLSIATELLYTKGLADNVCVLTLTKTRSNK